MAYRTRAFGYAGGRRALRRNGRFVLSRGRKRFPTPKRARIRRRTLQRRRMPSRRTILNVSSRKKQDNMRAWVQPIQSNSALDPTPGGLRILHADGVQMFAWRATQRERLTGTADPATVDDPATRTATTCYMRGLRENITLSLYSSHPWVWRRICFRFYGDSFDRNAIDPGLANIFAQFSLLTSGGYARAINTFDQTNEFAQDLRTRMQAYMFKGAEGTDWTDVFTAKTDSTRLAIAYDRRSYVRSHNDSPNERRLKIWHPMNQYLIYDEDESGGSQFNGSVSADTRKSMGDYYVVDFFSPVRGGTDGDDLYYEPQATLYWHER